MGVVYGLGVPQTFTCHKQRTFRHAGGYCPPLARYVATYALGYAATWLALALLVDHLGYPHAGVRAVMAAALAGALVLLQRLWFLRPSQTPPKGITGFEP